MEHVVCLFHPKYDGYSAPTLSCRTCCSLYIAVIKADGTNRLNKASLEAYNFIKQSGRKNSGESRRAKAASDIGAPESTK